MSTELWIRLAVYALIVVSSILSIIIAFTNRKKNKSSEQKGIVEPNENPTFLEKFNGVLQKLINNIWSTESFYNVITDKKCGSKKLQDVLTAINLSDRENYNEEEWTKIINSLITFSNNMNKKEDIEQSNQLDCEENKQIGVFIK